jgi:LacI family transcriptional regulator
MMKPKMVKRASSIDVTNVLLSLGWYYPEMHRGVARFARDHGWHVTADFDDPIPTHWHGDGVIALLGARHNHWQQLRRLKIPVVDLAESRPNIKLPRVTMDNMAIGRMAAEHFLESGYRHFAVYHRWGLGVSRRRCDAFKSIVNAAGHGCEQYLGRCRKAALPQATMNTALGQSANVALGQFASL